MAAAAPATTFEVNSPSTFHAALVPPPPPPIFTLNNQHGYHHCHHHQHHNLPHWSSFLQNRPAPYQRVSTTQSPSHSTIKSKTFYLKFGKTYACIAELLFDIARFHSGWSEKFIYDPKCPVSVVKAKCGKTLENIFCKCPFEVCSSAYMFLLKALQKEIATILSETFTSTSFPFVSIVVQLGNFQNPLYKVLESAGYAINYIFDFLQKLNFHMCVDKYLANCEIRSVGFTATINMYSFCNSQVNYASMLGKFFSP